MIPLDDADPEVGLSKAPSQIESNVFPVYQFVSWRAASLGLKRRRFEINIRDWMIKKGLPVTGRGFLVSWWERPGNQSERYLQKLFDTRAEAESLATRVGGKVEEVELSEMVVVKHLNRCGRIDYLWCRSEKEAEEWFKSRREEKPLEKRRKAVYWAGND